MGLEFNNRHTYTIEQKILYKKLNNENQKISKALNYILNISTLVFFFWDFNIVIYNM